MTFRCLRDALAQGFMVYDRTPRGYLVRKRTVDGFVIAEVILRT